MGTQQSNRPSRPLFTLVLDFSDRIPSLLGQATCAPSVRQFVRHAPRSSSSSSVKMMITATFATLCIHFIFHHPNNGSRQQAGCAWTGRGVEFGSPRVNAKQRTKNRIMLCGRGQSPTLWGMGMDGNQSIGGASITAQAPVSSKVNLIYILFNKTECD